MLDERFWSKVDKSRPNGCWEWTANKNNMGYGLFRPGGIAGKRLAHRLSFQNVHGTIGEGLCVLHRCDNPKCVNPRHLFLGTKKDNVADMIAKGRKVVGRSPNHVPPPQRGDDHFYRKHPERILRGERIGTAKLTVEAVQNIYQLLLAGRTIKSIARQYKLDSSSVNDIATGEHWTHLLGRDGAPTKEQLLALPRAKHGPTKIGRSDIPAIRRLFTEGVTGRAIAKRYGVHPATISDIRRGLTWRDA